MKTTIFSALLILYLGHGAAQTLKPDILTSAGDYYANSAGSLSWTLGEAVTETYADGSNILTQGFQQSSYALTSVDNIEQSKVKVSVYPNPFTSELNLTYEGNTALRIVIADMSGKIVSESILRTGGGSIDFHNLSDALYLLAIYDDNGLAIQTFKIQKIN